MPRLWKPRIPVDPELLGKAQVRQIASMTKLDHWAVVGRLIDFWLTAQVKADARGNLEGKSLTWLDCKVGQPGFAAAMVDAGWLEVTVTGIKVADFDAFVSKKAVRRLENADRMAGVRFDATHPTGCLCVVCAENVRRTPLQAEPKEPKKTRAPKKKVDKQPGLPVDDAIRTMFFRWWNEYPKHRQYNCKTSEAEFLKLSPDDALFERIMAALTVQRRSDQWTKENGQYVPSPVNWLRDRRWEDSAESARPVRAGARVQSEPGQFADRRPYQPRKAPAGDGDGAARGGGTLF